VSESIYRQEIKQLAEAAVGHFAFSAEERNSPHLVTLDIPLCGDRVTMRLLCEGGKVSSVAHEVRGCLLCRAAASAIGQSAPGCNEALLQEVKDSLTSLRGENAGNPFPQGWEALEAFRPVASHRSRHRCVVLPFEVLLRAYRNSGALQK